LKPEVTDGWRILCSEELYMNSLL